MSICLSFRRLKDMGGRGRPFEAGNKFGKGRASGSRNKRSVFQEALDNDGMQIIRAIKRLALKSDPTAMRLCMERLLPISKAWNSCFPLPSAETAESLTQAISAVMSAVAEGHLSAQEGESMAKIIESQRRSIETVDFDARLKVLEEAQKNQPRED
jgi:hypothetical protein